MTDDPHPPRPTDDAMIEFLIEQRRHLLAMAAAYQRMIDAMQGGKVGREKDRKD